MNHEGQTKENQRAPDNDRIGPMIIDSGVKGMSKMTKAALAETVKVVRQQNSSRNIRGGVVSPSPEL